MSVLLLLVLNQLPTCPVPSTHPLEPIQQAAQRDGERVLVLENALACRQSGAPCEAELAQCTATFAQSRAPEEAYDEAPWLADLETPYAGETFARTRIWTPAPKLPLTKCPASVLALRDLLGHATELHVRRNALGTEYVAYVAWAKDAFDRCNATPPTQAELDARTASTAVAQLEQEKALAAQARELTSAAET
ncbi:MAG: hypothetical protein ACOZQL_10235, partial [Myxococcota bacterium]